MGEATIERYVAHMLHVRKLVGTEHVAFGTDFDGMIDPEDKFIKGFDDASKFGNVIRELQKHRLTTSEVECIAYKNMERIIVSTIR